MSLAFTLGDLTGNVVSYTVAWGDGTTSTGNTGTGNTVVGVSVSLTHAYADAFAYAPNSNPSKATVTVTADNGSTPTPLPSASCTFVISYNAYPTATITSPQASDVLPSTTALPRRPRHRPGQSPQRHQPGPGGDPGGRHAQFLRRRHRARKRRSRPDLHLDLPERGAGECRPGQHRQSRLRVLQRRLRVITPCLVTLTVTDAFNRVSSNGPAAKVNTYEKWVIVDGTNSQVFNLSFLFRQRSGTPPRTPTPTPRPMPTATAPW